jgi:glycosyltransferase involved in cell wall biosynthesis
MKVLQIHNFYQWPGGEDRVYAAEFELLARHGHEVTQYSVHNDAIESVAAIGAATRTLWNFTTYREVSDLIARESPQVLHAHNTFPLVSPAIYYAAAAKGVPVVQTLHNYRLLCPAATLFRDGHVCEECVGAIAPYKAVVHRCYRDSALASATVASMLLSHRLSGTWRKKIHTYIALTEFSRDKFIEGGLPAKKIVIKPNFLSSDPGVGSGTGGYALYAGRLSEDKGLDTLLDAWEQLDSAIPLKIAGDGPLAGYVRERAGRLRNVEWLGYSPHERVMELLHNAAFLVFPSRWYEGLPMTLLESFACGTPVLVSSLGSLNELVSEGVNGFRFAPGNASALASCIRRILQTPDKLRAMRRFARACYEQRYTAEQNYELLMNIYRHALQPDRAEAPNFSGGIEIRMEKQRK